MFDYRFKFAAERNIARVPSRPPWLNRGAPCAWPAPAAQDSGIGRNACSIWMLHIACNI